MTPPARHPSATSGRFFRRIIILSGTVLLIVGTTLGWVAYDGYGQAEEFEFRLLEAHARNADVHVAETLGDIQHLLEWMAEAQLKHRSSPAATSITAELLRHRNDMPELGALLITGTDGRIRFSTDAALVGKNISSEPYFAALTDQQVAPKLFMSRPEDHLLGASAVIFSWPIVDGRQRFHGIAAVTIGYRFFPASMNAINPDDSESMSVIVNRDGDLVYRREEPERFFGKNIVKVSTIFREHFYLSKPVTRHIGPSAQNGRTRLFVVQDVESSGLTLILSRQLDDVLTVWRRNVVVYVLVFVCTVTALIVLMSSAVRRRQLEDEITASNECLRKIEHRQMLNHERQRLMQDMHDGLGSSLVSALRVVEHGQLDDAAVAQVLKDCIDDLKLTIDSLEPVEADLLLLLATLRFRLGPRLEASSIALHWKIQDVPALSWLTPRHSLHILRILQEAFTNIIKHANAEDITLATTVEDGGVIVTIVDNGRGFSVDQALRGRSKGMTNQMRRAESIGGTLRWESNEHGTRFFLWLPIGGGDRLSQQTSTTVAKP
ncbi:MAG TPA: ATP-binding protein [Rhodocyclaceae bacterium]|nr:ATP-binding protein [Rhodocyclaceae bacterium]